MMPLTLILLTVLVVAASAETISGEAEVKFENGKTWRWEIILITTDMSSAKLSYRFGLKGAHFDGAKWRELNVKTAGLYGGDTRSAYGQKDGYPVVFKWIKEEKKKRFLFFDTGGFDLLVEGAWK